MLFLNKLSPKFLFFTLRLQRKFVIPRSFLFLKRAQLNPLDHVMVWAEVTSLTQEWSQKFQIRVSLQLFHAPRESDPRTQINLPLAANVSRKRKAQMDSLWPIPFYTQLFDWLKNDPIPASVTSSFFSESYLFPRFNFPYPRNLTRQTSYVVGSPEEPLCSIAQFLEDILS